VNAVLAGLALIVLVVATYQWSKLREQSQESERRKLRAFVRTLPDWQPQILIMHVEERYNYLEIAAKLEMPAAYVLAELTKAYSLLRARELENEPPRKRRKRMYQARLIWKLMGGRS
jgi:DNA-directed RNA polymerase specialized sigma24 family protein